MEFYDMVQRLQLLYGMKIILISCGSFYISIGADAIVLNRELGLKLNCARKGICKVGVPKSSIEKYIEKIDDIGYAYIVLDYDKEKNKIIKLSEKQGKSIEETSFNNDCEKCNRRIYTVETEYEKALKEITKFLEDNLKLKLNNKTQIFKGKQGVNFCGYKINEYRMKLRDKGKRKLKKKVKKLTNKIYNGNMTSKDARMYLAGHMGYIKYANVKNLMERLFYIE